MLRRPIAESEPNEEGETSGIEHRWEHEVVALKDGLVVRGD